MHLCLMKQGNWSRAHPAWLRINTLLHILPKESSRARSRKSFLKALLRIMRSLFGTDGIRGVAGQKPLDPKTVYAVGLALAHQVKASNSHPRLLLGMDTRESSNWIAAALSAGITDGGAS